MGLLDNTVATAPDHLYGVVNTELVKQALSHTDDQVIYLQVLMKNICTYCRINLICGIIVN